MNEKEKFSSLFKFNSEMTGYVGIERERFLCSEDGPLVPKSRDFLDLAQDGIWTYELSACQVEDRTKPCRRTQELHKNLRENDRKGNSAAQKLNLSLLTQEVGPENMPLDVYPDKRYLEIVKDMPKEVLRAACRVTGTHIHLGVRNLEEAIRTHNAFIASIDEFCRIGDHSNGGRLRLYSVVAPNCMPPPYESIEQFFETGREQGFDTNPRNCWHLIRISIHGTVELRMFGATENLDEILSWIELIISKLQAPIKKKG